MGGYKEKRSSAEGKKEDEDEERERLNADKNEEKKVGEQKNRWGSCIPPCAASPHLRKEVQRVDKKAAEAATRMEATEQNVQKEEDMSDDDDDDDHGASHEAETWENAKLSSLKWPMLEQIPPRPGK